MKKNIRIEEVGDINSDYPYLEVFLEGDTSPFLEIAINNKELLFKIYTLKQNILLSYEEWEYIQKVANDFLPRALKDEDDYLKW
ncbi:hypothetical protein IQ37_12635 [Chryseobacterium piperi]|uniref:Uncharacterized protein n=1 Tax=Chryseobacterium piperi TaxID=558152 RepID=A0A086B8I4_9FLAO|nr:hypothetical protein [Chryseobacterium piperi]ASW74897.1 hypothetical protein CJF12_11805 [Chryseobacterium piperi]KFF25248.1 hypothetical protein IQ37_12635 [Chryseobacterium piperi]